MQIKIVVRCHCPPSGTDALETDAPRVGKDLEEPEATHHWWERPVVRRWEQCGPCDSAPPLSGIYRKECKDLLRNVQTAVFLIAPNWKWSSCHHPVCV